MLERRVRNGLNDDEGTTKINIIATVCLKTLEILKIKESVQEAYKYTLYAVELTLDPCITETRV